MGFLDRLFGREQPQQQPQQPQWGQQGGYGNQPQGYNPYAGQRTQRFDNQPQQLTDEQAIERYRYMLRTAPPETLEQAHAEAFAQLTPEQRRMVLDQLRQNLPENERNSRAYQSDDPQTLARMATRAEMRQPGTMERTFGATPMGGGVGLGGLMAGTFLSSIAGYMVGSLIAQSFFDNDAGFQDAGADGGQDAGGDYGDGGQAGDYGSGDYDTGGSFGGDGDYGGGDFGGGDFGGGDFGGGDF